MQNLRIHAIIRPIVIATQTSDSASLMEQSYDFNVDLLTKTRIDENSMKVKCAPWGSHVNLLFIYLHNLPIEQSNSTHLLMEYNWEIRLEKDLFCQRLLDHQEMPCFFALFSCFWGVSRHALTVIAFYVLIERTISFKLEQILQTIVVNINCACPMFPALSWL